MNSLIRVNLYTAAWLLSLGGSLAKVSAVRVVGFGFSFCRRDAFDLGGRMSIVR